ncbi:monocarboxylate transporter 13-like [Ptychodera flava]|uniref:monocarboxylate transporter 13-like n=1 Tax=Ptychodera flava TaxID=63121 RepID=UPI003969FFD9
MTDLQSSKEVTTAHSQDSTLTAHGKTRDGGVIGWLVVFGSHICHLFFGGAYQAIGPLFVVIQRHFDETSARTSWIIAFLASVEFGLGPLSNVSVKKIGFRMTVLMGTIISSAGYFFSAFAPTIEFLYLSIGLAVGIGYALILPASIGIIPHFVKKSFTVASVLAASGVGVGLFIFPPLLQILIDNYGWRGSVIVFSALNAHMGISAALFRAPEEEIPSNVPLEEKAGNANNLKMNWICIKDTCDLRLMTKYPTYAVFVFATTIAVGIGYQSSPAHLLARAETKQFASITAISLLVSIFGLATMIGRLLIPIVLLLTKKFTTSIKTYAFALFLSGLCNLFSPLAMNYETYTAYAFFYGIFIGLHLGMQPQIALDVLGPEMVTAGTGILTFFMAIGALIGPPIGGYIYDVTGNYDNSFYFYGSLLCFGGLVMFVSEPFTNRLQRKAEGATSVTMDDLGCSEVYLVEVATQTGVIS